MNETIFQITEIGLIPQDWNLGSILGNFYLKGRIGWQGLKASEFIDYGPYLVTGTDFENGHVVWDRCYHISEERFAQDPAIHVKLKDILITKDGTIGKTVFIDNKPEKVSLNSHLLIVRPTNNQYTNEYLYWVFNSNLFVEYYLAVQSGTTMASLSQDKISKFKYPLPSVKEQLRIAQVLRDTDDLIQALQRLLEKKKSIRNGALRNLLTGKRRISGFSNSWIGKNLGKSAIIKARIGWQGLTTNEYLESGDYYLITGTDFHDGRIDWEGCHYVSKERFEQDPYIKIQEKDVLVTKDGTIGKVAYLDHIPGPGTLNSGVFVIRTKDNEISQRYLAKVFISKFFDDFIDSIVAGSTIIHLYQKDIVKFDFFVPPTIDEQDAICDIIEDMDNEIRSLSKKLDKYVMLKEGMLQQLLTGKVRLLKTGDNV